MTVWRKHGGYKIEDLTLTDMHTIIDALEYHQEACSGVLPEYNEPAGVEMELVDIRHIQQAIRESGIIELVGRLPVSE